MKFDVKVDVSKLKGDITSAVSRIIRRATLLIEQKAKLAIQTGSKTGRVYTRRGRSHQASARGEAPATDTGFLVNSIQSTFPSALTGIVTVAAEYAQVLEDALDRPFVRPSVEATIEELSKGDITASFT